MTIKGTNGADVLKGSDNLNDIIFGGAGDDQLYGQGGNDILDGGAGNDYLEGGAGNDRYLWGTGAGNDTIHNAVQTIIWKEYLESGNDTVQFGAGITADAVEWQQNGEDVILKIKASGETLTFTNWFASSYVPVKTVRFADGTILTTEQVSALAVIKNTDGNDTLKGSDFRDDRIFGGAGNDTLNGGAGADTMIGGTGNDTYVVDNAGDIVIENAEEGIDTVQASITYTLSSHLENLTLTGTAAINGTGNDLDNVLIGNNGSNLLQSGAGNDTLNGGSGADTLIGGMGNDIYVVDNAGDIVIENAGEGIDTVQASVTYTLGSHQENLTLTLWSVINGTGNDLDNILTGNIVNNILNGGAGNDILDGGAGADTMIGGTGNDTYVVDSSGDIVIENAGEGIDTVETNLTYTLGSHLENLTLTGTGAINGTGNDLDNILTGNKRNNSLNGGAGNDILNGDAGNDVLDGGAGSDTLSGGLGNDTYVFGLGSGNDTVNSYEEMGSNGFDSLQFQNLVQAALEFTISGSDLICTLTQTGETMQLTNWILGTNYQVDQFRFIDGTLTAAQINQRVA